MVYLCPHQCDGKTEYGYCRYTWCVNPLHSNFGTAQQGQGVQRAVITNYDRIRAMSVEEMAEFMNCGACPPGKDVSELCHDEDGGSVPDMCNLCWLNWLKQEVSTNG